MGLILTQNIPVSKYVKNRFLVVVFVWGEGKTSTNPLILKQIKEKAYGKIFN